MASCAICDKPALFRCGKCRVERYCSRECQKDHWPHHKTRCPQLAATAKAAAERPAPLVSAAPDAQPSPARLQPHAPSHPVPSPPPLPSAAREQSGSFRSNPRTARLLRDIPPSLQTEAAAAAEEAAATSTADTATATATAATSEAADSDSARHTSMRGATASSDSAGGSGRAGTATAAAPGGVGDANHRGDGGGGGDSVGWGASGAADGGAGLSAPLSPSPPSGALSPRPPAAPRTPLPFQPAPPSGSPRPLPGSASMRLVRSHLREAASATALVSAASAPGGLQAEGSGMLRSGSSVGVGVGGGSILDRVSPLLPPPPPPAATGTSAAVAGSGARQPAAPPEVPAGAAAAADAAASAAGPDLPQKQQPSAPPSPSPQQQPSSWPWAGRSPAAAGSSGCSVTAVADKASAVAPVCLSDLPQEVLLEVLKALPARSLAAAAAVCRSWRRAAREPWLWVRQLCAAGYPLPAAAYVARRHSAAAEPPSPPPPRAAAAAATAASTGADDDDDDDGGGGGGCGKGARAVPGVRGIRAVRAVRAAGGSSHEDFLGGLRAGFLDRLQHQQHPQPRSSGSPGTGAQRQGPQQVYGTNPQQPPQQAQTQLPVDLKGLYGRTVRMESNWRCARYAESSLREHSSNVECLAFQRVEPWGSVLLSAAWDGSVRIFSLGPASGSPQQARCVRRYRGHTGWITCMAAGRHQVVTASTDRRVAAWRYYSESSDPWVALEHPQEVTLVRFCYAPPPPATTHYLAHHICGALHDPGATPSSRLKVGSSDSGTTTISPAAAQTHGTAAIAPAGDSDRGNAEYDTCSVGGPAQYCSAEALAAASPYDPQLEDWVVTGCIDGVIRLWHLPTKQLLRTFASHSDVVWGLAVLSGSSVMVSSSRDSTAKVWQLPPYKLMQAAVAPPPPGAAAEAAGGGGSEQLGHGGGAGMAAAAAAAAATAGGASAQTLDSMATLCGHTSAILCMDVHRAPPGVVPPPSQSAATGSARPPAAGSGASAAGGDATIDLSGGRSQLSGGTGTQTDTVAVLSYLLNISLVEPAAASTQPQTPAGSGGGGGGNDQLARAAAAGTLPVWLVATGGADAVVRVWNLATAQCHTTLRGHSVGVLSVQFGYLPRSADGPRDQQLLHANLDVTAAAPPPSMSLPPGQYGFAGSGGSGGCRAQQLPPSQRLVLVTGSVREVRVWDPISGSPLVQLADHSGPVTSLALVHGVLVTLAMNDGLIVYKCNGLDDCGEALQGGGDGGATSGSAGPLMGASPTAAAAAARPVSAAGRLRRAAAAQRKPLEPVICMQDAPHHSFSAALAVQLEGLAVGSGTGDITHLDLRPRASPLPLLNPRRRLL